MHDQHIGSACKVNETWVSSVLISAEYDGRGLRPYSVRKGGDVAVRYTDGVHRDVFLSEYCRRFSLRGINHRYLEWDAPPG
jgi:hypothetical protein